MPLAVAQAQMTVVRTDPQTGRLVRSVIAPKAAQSSLKKDEIAQIADRVAARQGIEAPLVHSVIRAESNYNPNAVSSKGAQGVMQLIPSTARRFGVRNAFDPKQNIEGGVRYLRFLLDYYKNDYPKTIAAYNAGEGAVDRYQGIPPYTETRNYVYQVAKNLRAARQAEEMKSKAAQQAVEQIAAEKAAPDSDGQAKSEEVYNPIRASVSEDGRVIYRTQ